VAHLAFQRHDVLVPHFNWTGTPRQQGVRLMTGRGPRVEVIHVIDIQVLYSSRPSPTVSMVRTELQELRKTCVIKQYFLDPASICDLYWIIPVRGCPSHISEASPSWPPFHIKASSSKQIHPTSEAAFSSNSVLDRVLETLASHHQCYLLKLAGVQPPEVWNSQ
jgi:hypothetical protein